MRFYDKYDTSYVIHTLIQALFTTQASNPLVLHSKSMPRPVFICQATNSPLITSWPPSDHPCTGPLESHHNIIILCEQPISKSPNKLFSLLATYHNCSYISGGKLTPPLPLTLPPRSFFPALVAPGSTPHGMNHPQKPSRVY